MQRELPWKSVLSLAYVGRRGLHLQRESNINQPTPDVVAANPGLTWMPYKGYNSIRETDNVASSMYNSFQLNWNRRFTAGLMIGLSFLDSPGRWFACRRPTGLRRIPWIEIQPPRRNGRNRAFHLARADSKSSGCNHPARRERSTGDRFAATVFRNPHAS